MSLGRKTIVFGLLPLTLVTVVIGVVIVTGTRETSLTNGRALLVDAADSVAAAVEQDTILASSVVETLAVTQEEGMFGDRAATLDVIAGVLDRFPQILGADVAYAPDADGNDAAWLASGLPAEAMEPRASFGTWPSERRSAAGGVSSAMVVPRAFIAARSPGCHPGMVRPGITCTRNPARTATAGVATCRSRRRRSPGCSVRRGPRAMHLFAPQRDPRQSVV